MKMTSFTYLLILLVSMASLMTLPSCDTCRGKEPYEAFDFRLVDTNGNNVVGETLSITPDQIAFNLNGQNLLNGFYSHPDRGVTFIVDYGKLDKGDNEGDLMVGNPTDTMPIVVSINALSDNCFNYNRVTKITVDGADYEVSDLIDIIK